jgi:hypothetical protein
MLDPCRSLPLAQACRRLAVSLMPALIARAAAAVQTSFTSLAAIAAIAAFGAGFGAGSLHPLAASTLDLSSIPSIPTAQALAQDSPGAPVQMVKAPDLASAAELVRFDAELLPALLRVRPGERVLISGWPVAPGARRDVVIARHEVYAPGARVLQVDAGGVRELPRSRLVFFWGTEVDDPESGIFVSADPVSGIFESLSNSAAGRYQLRPLVPGKAGLHLVATAEAFLAGATGGKKPTWHCSEETLVPLLRGAAAGEDSSTGRAPREPGAVIASGSFNLATIAVDTDHQFMANKFNNDTIQATNYIASLFAAINVMYERDVQVQLLVGDTILRTSAAADPYTVNPNGSANGAELNEFASYWSTNYGSVSRTLAAMLSGKEPDNSSSSGIANVGGLCSTTNGYSFDQVFLVDYLAGDAEVFGHEIGHNFGSEHTHCYSPPIDMCFAQEPGCYSGPTSCPAVTTLNGVTGVTGTMMSYCNLLGGCGVSMVFHPRVVAVLQSNVTSALGVCMTASGPPPPVVTAISPNHGPVAGGTPVVISGSNFRSGDTVKIGGVAATSVVVSGPGTITATTGAHATGTVDVVVTDGGGAASTLGGSYFYAPAPITSHFYTVTPCRVLDTRNPNGALGGPALVGGATRSFTISGSCGIPASATAVSANVTVIGASTGVLSLFPGNALPLGTSNINFIAGRVRANNAILMLATDGTGTVAVQNVGATGTQFLLDVNGYFK